MTQEEMQKALAAIDRKGELKHSLEKLRTPFLDGGVPNKIKVKIPGLCEITIETELLENAIISEIGRLHEYLESIGVTESNG